MAFIIHLICSFTAFEVINAYPLFGFFDVVNKFIVFFSRVTFKSLKIDL